VPRQEPDEVLREREAQAVAAAVQSLVRAGRVDAGDIQVLCRKRESLRLVADALAALHVPFAAAEDFALMDAPEVRDLVALLDALVSPQHALSLAHALRSPVFSASDDDLVELARASATHRDWWRALRELEAPSPALLRARDCFGRWRVAARHLPPHDLLDLIVGEGEVRERLAAAVPPERRAAALAAVDALLQQALTLDGARYATPYNFVRALRRREIKVPASLQPGAVQLLTVHGAKGLEASVVFVIDSDPEPKGAEAATLLVDWPVESAHPACCAFVYTPSRCPAPLVPVLERELAAREREELNGLYVAMTRARAQLVFSATEPSKAQERRSWWDRIQPWVRAGDVADASSAHAGVVSATSTTLAVLPPLEGRRPVVAHAATERDEASRLGQAVAPRARVGCHRGACRRGHAGSAGNRRGARVPGRCGGGDASGPSASGRAPRVRASSAAPPCAGQATRYPSAMPAMRCASTASCSWTTPGGYSTTSCGTRRKRCRNTAHSSCAIATPCDACSRKTRCAVRSSRATVTLSRSIDRGPFVTLHEGRGVRRITHSHIVPVLEANTHAGAIPGTSLAPSWGMPPRRMERSAHETDLGHYGAARTNRN
jgi:hypothetical protein